jgi:hypothetical protein
MTASAYALVAERLAAVGSDVRNGSARCPAHADRQPSLSVRRAADRVLVTCFGGCRTDEVVAALGLKMADLFDKAEQPWRKPWVPPRPVVEPDPSWTYVRELPDDPYDSRMTIWSATTAEVEPARLALAETARRNRAHDAGVIARGLALEPAWTSWREVHVSVSPSVWRRVWNDLAPGTRARHADLAPEVV